MGRQAYLNKIALGRSAFEATQITSQSTAYIQLESSQQELPPAYQVANPNAYIQLYDERGNPTNPRSRDYGRSLREAQNDVLAAIGVVERRRSPSDGLPGSYEEQLGLMEAEDTVGNAIALASTLTENLCTWWIGAIRERVLTFRINDAFPFTRIIATERRATGWSLVYTGFPSRLLATVSTQAIVYAAFVYRPIDRMLHATHASLKTRQFFRRWKSVSKFCLRLTLEVLFYPLTYHASLQRLGLIPARPVLPYWKSFIPFSQWSPIFPFSLHFALAGSPMDCLKAILTSPLTFVCLQHFYERWVYAAIYEAVEISVIHPDNPDVLSPDDGVKNRANAILGLRRKSPAPLRNAINQLLVLLGWADSFPGEDGGRKQPADLVQRPELEDGQTIEVGGTQVSNVARLELATSQQTLSPEESGIRPIATSNEDVVIVPVSSLDDIPLPQTPPSPTASTVSQDDNDPRIRITSREGIVEMEVRLPPHILSSHTEVADAHSPELHARDAPPPYLAPRSETRAHHRVTQLSSEPSQMIGAICKAQIVGWTNIPLKLVTLHLIAGHFLATRGANDGIYRTLHPLPGLHDLTWRSVGTQASRIALCGALELAIDLSLWGCQNVAITWIGRNGFGWGAL